MIVNASWSTLWQSAVGHKKGMTLNVNIADQFLVNYEKPLLEKIKNNEFKRQDERNRIMRLLNQQCDSAYPIGFKSPVFRFKPPNAKYFPIQIYTPYPTLIDLIFIEEEFARLQLAPDQSRKLLENQTSIDGETLRSILAHVKFRINTLREGEPLLVKYRNSNTIKLAADIINIELYDIYSGEKFDRVKITNPGMVFNNYKEAIKVPDCVRRLHIELSEEDVPSEVLPIV